MLRLPRPPLSSRSSGAARRSRRSLRLRRPRRFVALLGVLTWALLPGIALAADDQVRLALLPIDQPGPYFDVTMRPGERRTFSVELADASDVAVAVRTYAADVYTIVNGGFGGRLRDEPRTAMTAWLDYPTAVHDLQPGGHLRQSFTVAVPRDASPGEYITSIVLENDIPIAGDGPLALDQVVRQAVAVVVTLPGPRLPALTIGAAGHRLVAGRSVVSVAVANPGNIRLKPIVEFALSNAAGSVVAESTVPMDTFYARTETSIEVPLSGQLPPGAYTIRLSLDDAMQGARAVEPAIPLTVEKPPIVAAGDAPGAALIAIGEGGGPLGGGLPVVAILLAAGLVPIALLGRVWIVRRRSPVR
jgi:hypothetical protein